MTTASINNEPDGSRKSDGPNEAEAPPQDRDTPPDSVANSDGETDGETGGAETGGETGADATGDEDQRDADGGTGSAEEHSAEPSEQVVALEARVASLERELESTVESYRLSLLASAPDVPEELVTGQSATALDASLASARTVVEQIRARIVAAQDEAEPAPPPVMPAGAPPRSMNDGAADLSARDKIARGLERL